MEKLSLINGNGKEYSIDMPKIIILTDFINDGALKHIKENTGIEFKEDLYFTKAYIGQPTNSTQFTKLFLTYNFITQYYNNYDHKNTIFLKFASYKSGAFMKLQD